MEYLDIVNENDKVIWVAEKKEVYERFLTHRIVHILIFNEKNEIALQLRSSKVSYCPNHWSTSVGGHVQSWETYEEAALREYKEELWIKYKIEFFSKDYYRLPWLPDKFLTTYKSSYSWSFSPDLWAVKKVEFFSIKKIKEMIEHWEKFHPELLFILNKYFF